MKKTTTITILYLLLGCASHKKTNRLASEIVCNKDFYFAYDQENSFQNFNYKGLHFGNSEFPDFEESFIKSIHDLNQDTQMEVKFVESKMLPSHSYVYAKVRVEEIRWNWRFADAELEVDLEYVIGKQKIHVTGKNKVQLAATKKGNLFKAFKNGHYQFISAVCAP